MMQNFAARSIAIKVLVIFCAISPFAQTSKIKTGTMSRAETEIRAMIGAWAESVRTHDSKTLDAIFADDLFITDYDGGTRGKKEELEILKPSANVKTISIENEDILVRLSGGSKIATVTAIVRMVFDVNGKRSQMSMRYTSVWEKRKGSWRLVILHTARLASPKAA